MRIEIINWLKYNPRSDIRSTSWFRIENTILSDPVLTSIGNDGIVVWLFLLSSASLKQQETVEIDLKHACKSVRTRCKTFLAILSHFEVCGKIKIVTSRTSRIRDDTERTDGTGRDGTIKECPKSASPTPDPSLLENENSNLPKPRFSDWDMKAAQWLQKAIALHNPNARKIYSAKLERWANDFRLMRERDKLGETLIKDAMQRLFDPEHPDFIADPFWRVTIQSPPALRKYWDRVTALINNPKPPPGGFYK